MIHFYIFPNMTGFLSYDIGFVVKKDLKIDFFSMMSYVAYMFIAYVEIQILFTLVSTERSPCFS